jgi:hypothetical protein
MKMDSKWKKGWTLNSMFWEKNNKQQKGIQGEEGDDKPYKISSNMHVRCKMQESCKL